MIKKDKKCISKFQSILSKYLVESAAKASNIPYSSDSDEDNLYDNCDTVTVKPLKKGRNLLSSGFVENVQDNFDEIKHEFYVCAHMQHSMKNMLPLNVNVVISDISGYVKVAMCDCKVSALGRCAHVAALLLKLSDAAHDKGSTIKAVHVTTRHMEGKKHDKKSQRLHEAEYSSSKRKPPSELYMWDLRPENKRCVKEDDIKNLVVDLQADNNPSMWVTLLSITYDDFKLEQSDITIYRNYAVFSGFCESQSYHPKVRNLLLRSLTPNTRRSQIVGIQRRNFA